MDFNKIKEFKMSKVAAIVLAGAVTFCGIGVMVLTNQTKAEEPAKTVLTEQKDTLSVPGAGMGDVLEDYVGATSGSSVELLSTTALAASMEDTYNEYYDENGNTIGKLIVYNGESAADVYNKIVGNERIENGEVPAEVIGHMYKGDVATLVTIQGNWYQIISDSVNGFVRKEGFAKGVEAEKLNNSTYVNAVYVNQDNVLMYAEDYDTSTVVCVVPKGVRCTLVEAGDTLSKIYVPGVGEGWIVNTDATFQTDRRYATDISSEIFSQTAVSEGVALAAQVEEIRQDQAEAEAQAAEQLAAEQMAAAAGEGTGAAYYQPINIAPAPADTADVAALRQAVADYAQAFVGVLPYMWGNSDLSVGADCSGFTSAIYRAYGYEISRSSDAQYYDGVPVSLDDLRPGDIICYPGHVGMYVGNGTIVHESVPGTTASYADINIMPINGAVRIIN